MCEELASKYLETLMRKYGLMRNVRRRKSNPVAATESLEQRALLTAMVSGSTLQIVGTDAADSIVVTQSGGQLMVQENDDPVQSFPLGGISLVKIDGAGGNDNINTRDIGLPSRIDGGSGSDTIVGGNGPNDIRGNAGNDTITGYRFRDVISGGAGNDVIRGQGSGDVLRGGNGDDTIFGADGADSIFGGSGADSLRGADGDDTVFGENGSDMMDGADGDDELHGGGGNDVVMGDSGDDTIQGGSGADTLTGGDGNEIMIGSDGKDVLGGGNGMDILVGGGNRDQLMGGADGDILIAGTTDLGVDELMLVAAEWESGNDYDQRVANIRNGDGRDNSRSNEDAYLIGINRNHFSTVFSDLGQIDELMGEAGLDWFFIADGAGDDDVNDRNGEERRELI